MSVRSGTRYETERKRILESYGFIVINAGQNESCDLIVISEDMSWIEEVKSIMNGSTRFDFHTEQLRSQFHRLSVISEKYDVDYVFRLKGGTWKIYDVGPFINCPSSIRVDLLPDSDYQKVKS